MPEPHAIPVPGPLWEKARRWEEAWGLPGLLDSVTVEFSTRMRVSLGLCRPVQGRIRLAASLLNGGADPGTGGLPASEARSSLRNGNAHLLEEVLCHELAHVAVHRLYGRRAKPHGPEWKSLLVKAGYEPRVRVVENDPRLPAAFNKPRPRWEHRCPVCHARRVAGRLVRQWRCVACLKAGLSGKLVITKLPPPVEGAGR